MTVHFGDEATNRIDFTVTFSPEGEVPEQFVERLLTKHPGAYEKVETVDAPTEPVAKAVCDVCGQEFKNEQGVLIHKKRKHKE
jgi:hypothetical protein